jgi:hypothetical protein
MNKRLLFVLLCIFSCKAYSDAHIARTELLNHYEYNNNTLSDINDHLPHLRRLAQDCSSVTEIGLRTMVSSWGILMGLADSEQLDRSYVGIDIRHPLEWSLQRAQILSEACGISFQFLLANDMTIDIEDTDMLFIDTLHTYCHLTYELEKFSPKVRKYIAMHDTSEPWGIYDESIYSGNYSEYPPHISKTKRGLWAAVADFLQSHPEWILKERYFNNHGFTVLERIADFNTALTMEESPLDYALNNKIIYCTGPSLRKRQLLIETTEKDMAIIPFKKIFLSTNDPNLADVTFAGVTPVVEVIPERGHGLDCLNCIISSIRNVANDPECLDDDIILFKHETVYINDMYLFRKAVNKILEGNDLVMRYYAPDQFYMTDMFLLKVSTVREIFQDRALATAFDDTFKFCEDYFTKFIAPLIPKIYTVNYWHSTRKDTELGCYHIPKPAEENWPGYWDKRNYFELFK